MKMLMLSLSVFTVTNLMSQISCDSLYQQARKQDSIGNKEIALQLYTNVISIDSSIINAYFNRAMIEIQSGKYSEAIKDLAYFDISSPNDYEVQYYLAVCNYQLNNVSAALFYVNSSLILNENFLDALKLKASIELEGGDFNEALKELSKAELVNEKDGSIFFLQGFCYEGLKDTLNALFAYLKSIELGINYAAVYNNVGSLYYKLKDYKNAIYYFKIAISISPDLGIAYYGVGVAYYDLGMLTEALAYWNQAKLHGYTQFESKILKIIEEN